MRRRRSIPALDSYHWRILGLLGAASFFEGYDLNVVIFALPHIRATFHLSQASAALWLSLLYLGALPAVWLGRRADRRGRRSTLLITICGYTLATAATSLAPDMAVFAVCQFAARFFLAAEISVSWTVVAEELPAEARGFGFGCLATLDILGSGAGALLWGAALAPFGVSWRWLYAAVVPALLLVIWLRRRLPESHRYLTVAATRSWSRWNELLGAPYRRNLTLVCAMAFLVNLTTSAQVFVIDFLQSQRHLSTSAANLVLVAAGALAVPALAVSGAISDHVGRRRVGVISTLIGCGGLYVFFFAAHATGTLLAGLTLVYIGSFGAWPALAAFGLELFPTPLRALGSSSAGACKVVGQSCGFIGAGVLIGSISSLPKAVAILSAGPLLAALLVLTAIPETSGQAIDGEELIGPSTGQRRGRRGTSLDERGATVS